MKSILECCRLEIRMIFKSWLARILVPTLMLYTSIGVMVEAKFSPGFTMSGSAYLVEAGMFLFIIIGYNMIREEEKYSCEEVFYAMRFGRVSKISGKFLALVVTAFTLSGAILSIFYIFFIKYRVTYILYVKGIPFFALYYLLPFIIVGIIGMIIGILVKGKLGYLLIILFWILCGTVNEILFVPILRIFKIQHDIAPITNFLNLAQADPEFQFNNLYGFSLEIGRWYQKGVILTVLFTLLMMLIIMKSSKKKLIWLFSTSIIGTVITLVFLTQYLKPSQIIEGRDAGGRADFIYYLRHKANYESKEDSFRINSYDIDMVASRILKVNLKIEVKALKSVDKLEMTMYRDLIIQNVESEGRKLSFNQIGDFLTINLPKTLDKDKDVKIELQYEGKSSPLFFANEQAVMLPAYYAWIPREGNFQIMDEWSGYGYNKVHEAYYKLKYRGPSNLYTNLPAAGSNIWEGTAKDGITLVASDYMGSTEVEDIKVCYPLSLCNSVPDFKKLIENVKTSRKNILMDFHKEEDNHKVEVIFILPPPNVYTGSTAVHKFNNHMIIEFGQMEIDMHIDLLRQVHQNLISINDLIRTEYKNNNSIAFQFQQAYEYWYALRFAPELAKETDLVKRGSDRNFDYYGIYRILKSKIDSNIDNEEVLRELFNKLLEAVKQKNEDEFKRLLGL